MAEQLTPKAELVVTLDAAWLLLEDTGLLPPSVRLAQMRGLLDHARALALRVGEERRDRKAKPERPIHDSVEVRNATEAAR